MNNIPEETRSELQSQWNSGMSYIELIDNFDP